MSRASLAPFHVELAVRRGPHPGVSRAEVLRRVRSMMALLQLEKEELSITLTDDDQIHILNRDYRGKDKPTDVLAFAMREGDFSALAGHVLGDVVVSVETARRQAKKARRPLLEELTMLLAHGLLHLLGWDHETAAKDRAMRAETDRLCEAARAGSSPPARPARKPPGPAPSPKRTARKGALAKAPAAAKGRARSPRATVKSSPQSKEPRRR